jgi:hypothetical protein
LALAGCLASLTAVAAEIAMPLPPRSAPIVIRADEARRWEQGRYEVWLMAGRCAILQEPLRIEGQQAVLWVQRADPVDEQPSKIIAYVEGEVAVLYGREGSPHRRSGRAGEALYDRQWLGRLYTVGRISVEAPVSPGPPQVLPAVFNRAVQARDTEFDPAVRPAQFSSTLPGYRPGPRPGLAPRVPPPPAEPAPPSLPAWPAPGAAAGPQPLPAREAPAVPPRPAVRSLVIRSRGNVRMDGRVFPSPDGSATIATITTGVNVVVDGIESLREYDIGKIDIETDRIVIWTARLDALDLTGESSGEKLQPKDAPLEFYMEGNIVFRESDRVLYAERMYYNVKQHYGIVLNAEVLSPAPGYQGLVRLKANVLQQLDDYHFRAYNAAVTTSRLGVPRYWLQAENVEFEDRQVPLLDPALGQLAVDPETGEAAVDHEYRVRSRNNFLYVSGVPVLYWPALSTNLKKPTFYVDGLTVRNDGVLGFQVFPDLDMFQLLALRNPPEGVDWTLTPTYFTKRGFGLGTEVKYDRADFLNIPGHVHGHLEAWGLHDEGLDNLGRDRRAVQPETDWRGRVLWQHRQQLSNGFQFIGEVGWISDRNFLEQYYQREWDEHKDQTTGLELKRLDGASSWSVTADVRLNDFFTQTEWLPRGDHFLLGYSLFDRFTWFAHSQVGYAQLRTAELPGPGTGEPVPAALLWERDLLGNPYEQRSGLRAATRQELDLPLPVGPFKVTPYVLGEAAFWQQDVAATEVTRLYGQAGVRASLPLWTAYPGVQSTLLNLNGLAHKVEFRTDFFWADADQPLSRLALYDALDDDATEHFRRRFLASLFDGGLPPESPWRFDERYFALRTGLQNWVTSPSTEIAGDLAVAQLGVHQRWQTKRGAPGQQQIEDWITLDIGGSFFPKADRDNFGQEFGLLNYDFRWNVGERLALLSDGFADLFADGLRTVSIGAQIGRPQRGTLYLGFRTIDGPVDSHVLSAAVNYRMSEKWILNASAAFDFGETGAMGENLSFVRIGESTLMRIGLHIDPSRGSVGFAFALEPRFLHGRLGRVAGEPLPPVGAFGVE